MIPRLNRHLVLEVQVRTPDGAGGYTNSWSELGKLWGEVLPGSSSSTSRGGVVVYQQKMKITVRGAPQGKPSRPISGQRLRDVNRVYLIESVTERDAEGRFLVCTAREEVTQ